MNLVLNCLRTVLAHPMQEFQDLPILTAEFNELDNRICEDLINCKDINKGTIIEVDQRLTLRLSAIAIFVVCSRWVLVRTKRWSWYSSRQDCNKLMRICQRVGRSQIEINPDQKYVSVHESVAQTDRDAPQRYDAVKRKAFVADIGRRLRCCFRM
jgi:hypothetical protein